ncbi:alanyl-tRNA editing protein [Candidatus Micrarchaeota archaeon]|nr:alanyl-tRNA editing protein [Candidatus Micrarchaeota archaeon]
MTDLLFMDNSYLKECDAVVKSINDIQSETVIRLDRTIFYPKGGGVLSDTGRLVVGDANFIVKEVYKYNGDVFHVVDVGEGRDGVKEDVKENAKEKLGVGVKVRCIIDWNRRYTMMKYHTAAHVLTSRFYNMGARITGNQITPEKARFDFNLPDFDRRMMEQAVQEANFYFGNDIPVNVFYMDRKDVLNNPELVKLADKMPPDVNKLRIVKIGTDDDLVDIQADGGPHVKNLNEIPKIEIMKMENKGKGNKRIYFKFKD